MKWYKDKMVYLMILIGIVFFLIRTLFFEEQSGDYVVFLKPWVDYMRNNGGIFSLGETFTNYNLPYLTLLALISYIPSEPLLFIKLISIVFDFGIAIVGFKMVYDFSKDNKYINGFITYIILLCAPTIILNSSVWAQCDSIYTFFLLLALYYLIKEKYHRAFIFLGCSFAFKLQFIFILPLFGIYFLCKDKRLWKYFLYIPLVNFILCIPGMLVGASPLYTYEIYFLQVGYYTEALNVANMYNFLPVGSVVNYIGMGITMLIFICLLIYCFVDKVKWNDRSIITIGLLCILICYFFLPCMHERYMYVADVLSIIWFMIYKRNFFVPIIINFVSLVTYLNFLFGVNIGQSTLNLSAIFLLIGIIMVFSDLSYKNQSSL